MQTKVCTTCQIDKDLSEYYLYKGNYRSECKKCKTKKNMAQSKKRAISRDEYDREQMRQYSREYYAKNKHKFVIYRKTFAEKHPDYHRVYARSKKERQPNDWRPNSSKFCQNTHKHSNI